MRILIAYDGLEGADVAIDDLCRAGLPDEAEVLLATVAEVWLPPEAEEQHNSLEGEPAVPAPKIVRQMWARGELHVEQARELAEKAATRVRHNFPRWNVECRAVSGSPAWEILRLADEWKPELIVVGSHGHSRLGSLVLGSVSQDILTEAKCSVRVGRGTTLVGEPPQRILIGVDGSASSFAAVEQVAVRHWLPGTEIRVAIVYDEIQTTLVGSVIPAVSDEVSELNASQHEWATEIASNAVAKLEDAGWNAEAIVEPGDPKHVLVEYANTWESDCIFVGSTGVTSSVERLLLGSVSAAVAARAKCSTEVVRSPESSPD